MLLSSVWDKSIAAEFADGPLILLMANTPCATKIWKAWKGVVLKVVFDVSEAGKDGALNVSFDTSRACF